MPFCLPKFAADALIKALPEDLSKLTEMTSAERRSFFADLVGEANAKETNALFESKLILKDQQQGIINWVKKVTGMTPEVKRDIIARVNNLTEVLQPRERDMFLEDLASKRLGMDVTVEEAGRIADLAKRVEDAKAAMENGGDRMDFGRARVDFSNYVGDLKLEANKIPLKDYLQPKNYLKAIENVAGQSKAITASMDLSALLRQGGKAFFTNPKIWAENALKSLKSVAKTLGGDKNVMDEVNAEILSRPTYEKMLKAKLDVGSTEEAFPTALPEKIPLFGRLYKASEVGFTSFLHRIRADIFDKTLEIAKDAGVDTDNVDQLRSMGNLVNSLTGRGNLGRIEPVAGLVNNVFFSPRYLKSQFDVLTAHTFQKGVTPFVRKQAAINLAKIAVGQAAILAIAKVLQPQSVDADPHSSAFGKVKVKDASTLALLVADGLGISANRSTTNPYTTFDTTTGEASLIVLATRLVPLIVGGDSYTKSVAGKISPLNSGKFGSATGFDVAMDFLKGKASPAVSALILNRLIGQDFNGDKPTFLNTLKNLFVPISVQNALPQNNKKK